MAKPKKALEEDAGETTVWISFRINPVIVKTLDEVAKKEDRSRASVIRRQLVKFHEEVEQAS